MRSLNRGTNFYAQLAAAERRKQGDTEMVDFNKIKEENRRKRLAEEASEDSKKEKRSELELVNACLECDVTEWANNFLLSVKGWLSRSSTNYCSVKQRAKLIEIAEEQGVSLYRPIEATPRAVITSGPPIGARERQREKAKQEDDWEDDIPF